MLSSLQIHLALVGFCMSPIPRMLMQEQRGRDIGGDFEFKDDGDIGALCLLLVRACPPAANGRRLACRRERVTEKYFK